MNLEQEIIVNREIYTEELYDMMQLYWDTEKQGPFLMETRNPLSEELCIFLPATKRFMVLAAPAESGIVHKQFKVVLSVIETPAGMEEELKRSFPTRSLIFSVFKFGRLRSIEKERNGPARDKLLEYTGYFRKMLKNAGLLC